MEDDSVTSISISGRQLEALASLAKKSLPNESCALLLGDGKSKISVSDVVPVKNAEQSRTSFTIDPQVLFDTYKMAETKGLHVVGIFHSHPAKPSPSITDAKYMEINPVVWLIYSTISNDFRAYIFENGTKEVPVRITA